MGRHTQLLLERVLQIFPRNLHRGINELKSMWLFLVCLCTCVDLDAWKIVGKDFTCLEDICISIGAKLLMAPPALADGFGISQVKETVRPFNELNPLVKGALLWACARTPQH